jgi:hypothetical protein
LSQGGASGTAVQGAWANYPTANRCSHGGCRLSALPSFLPARTAAAGAVAPVVCVGIFRMARRADLVANGEQTPCGSFAFGAMSVGPFAKAS